MSSYAPGDLVRLTDRRVGEVVGLDGDNIEVSWLRRTEQQNGKIFMFGGTQDWDCIHHSLVATHVSPGSRPIQRANMVLAWQKLGFVAGGDGLTFCRVEDENTVTLPLYEGAEDESEDEVSNEMQDFIVNDADGEAFTFADPAQLEGSARQFVLDTHSAVHEFERWAPTKDSDKKVKAWMEACAARVSSQHDERVFAAGDSALNLKVPPLK